MSLDFVMRVPIGAVLYVIVSRLRDGESEVGFES